MGKYLITMKNAGEHIQGSPFLCRVYGQSIIHYLARLNDLSL